MTPRVIEEFANIRVARKSRQSKSRQPRVGQSFRFYFVKKCAKDRALPLNKHEFYGYLFGYQINMLYNILIKLKEM